jgi:polyhydroxybutyrate depolymerase
VGIMAGSLIGRATACVNHPIAAWMTHGTADNAAIGGVEFTAGEAARDRIVTLNHCAATTQPGMPSPCVTYDGCDAGNPVVWCPVEGEAHAIPPFGPSAIAAFFLQF